ncbi:MAG: M48 family metallopeptidase [Betaproteobacteria bacterium]|nr:M48 family metallopeptidase [Betaproteobacteria bacterium]
MKANESTSTLPQPIASNNEGVAWDGIWYDGLSAHPHRLRVEVGREHLLLLPESSGLAEARRYALADLTCPEPWQGVARGLSLPDGSSLWVDDDAAANFLHALQRAGVLSSKAGRLMQSWTWGVVATLLVLALVVWLDRKGIPWAAEWAVQSLPPRIENRILQPVFEHFDRLQLAPSELPPERRERLRQRFMAAATALAPEQEFQLEFRTLPGRAAINAFALPGHIVVFDDLVWYLDEDEVLGVLGHELGHLVHRHGMEGLLRTGGLVILGTAVLGDASMLGAGALVLARSRQHSREAEREADVYALRLVDAAGVPRRALVSFMQKFEAIEKDASLSPEWALSHPATTSRREYFEQQAAQDPPR